MFIYDQSKRSVTLTSVLSVAYYRRIIFECLTWLSGDLR